MPLVMPWWLLAHGVWPEFVGRRGPTGGALRAKSRHAGDRLAEHELVDVVRAFVRGDALEIAHVPEALVLIENADAAEEVASLPRDIERDRDIVHLGHGDLLMRGAARVLQLGEPDNQQLSLGDLGEHPRQLLLYELEPGDRPAKHDPRLCILSRLVETRHR